jgi:hypothetical protein
VALRFITAKPLAACSAPGPGGIIPRYEPERRASARDRRHRNRRGASLALTGFAAPLKVAAILVRGANSTDQGGGKRLVEGMGSQVFRTCSYSNEMKDAERSLGGGFRDVMASFNGCRPPSHIAASFACY